MKKKFYKRRLTIKQKRRLLEFLAVIVLVGVIYQFASSRAQTLENDVRVAENSDLTYYLEVLYDGKGTEIETSSETASIRVYSDYIYVEDKLPEGLIFKEFVNTEDGTIGATNQKIEGRSCPGYVVGGYDGLTYDETTRMVSFKIKNLQAGCKVTVGIVTRTPSLDGKERMDFYNTAFARENKLSTKSNTVHVFMGREEATLYNVSYEYTGDIPENAPTVPQTTSYSSGTKVGVSNDISVAGYTFSGWTTEDVTVTNGTFEMPEKNIVFKGHFEKKATYQVGYTISGEKPDGYMPPKTKEYGEGDDVTVDSLRPGDEVDGYRFLGWETTDITLEEAKKDESQVFQMPKKNVSFTGRFEQIKYKVTYQFQGTIIPPNATSLLPAEKQYAPGTTVTREQDPTSDGYRFLGWYKTETFEMPEEDVIIYGEWMKEVGNFSPTITKQIIDKKSSYSNGEKVNFQITVTNTANYALHDVMIEEHTEKSSFLANENYEILNDRFVKIPTIAANSSVTVYAEYTAGEEVAKKVTNEVELTGALAENGYILDTTKEYIATVDFDIANIRLQINKVGEENEKIEGAEFTLYEDENLTKKFSTGLSFKGMTPGHTYYLKETKTKVGYVLLKDVLKVVVAEDGRVAIAGYDVTNNNGTAEVTIINKKINILPNTGGIGVIPFVIGGLLLVLVAAVGIMCFLRRKKGAK